jgi:hypothetical protein
LKLSDFLHFDISSFLINFPPSKLEMHEEI